MSSRFQLLIPLLATLFSSLLASGAHAASVGELIEYDCHLKGIPSQVSCGTLEVPLDHRQPNGRTLSLNFARLPAIKRSNRSEHRDPLVFLAGGPGQSAVSVARQIYYTFSRLRRNRDILLIDQRGTGDSFPLRCPTDTETQQDSDAFLGLQPVDSEQITDCLAKLQQQGADLSLFTTEYAVNDIEYLRQALGYSQVNLYGGSYGTRAALIYMRLYPDSLRSVVLDGVAPVDVPIGAFGQASAQAFELALQACANDQTCAAAFPELRADFTQLQTQLAKQPLIQAITHPYTAKPAQFELDKLKLINLLRLSLYSPHTRALLPVMINQAAQGNYLPLMGLALQASGPDLNLYSGLHLNIVCNEDFPRLSAAQLAHDSDNSFGGDTSQTLYRIACPLWPKYSPPPSFEQPLSTEIPTLLLSGRYDPVTPPANAERVAKRLDNARHIVAEHGGHTVAFHTCAYQLVTRFIERPRPDKLDASCLEKQDPVAFALNVNAGYSTGN